MRRAHHAQRRQGCGAGGKFCVNREAMHTFSSGAIFFRSISFFFVLCVQQSVQLQQAQVAALSADGQSPVNSVRLARCFRGAARCGGGILLLRRGASRWREGIFTLLSLAPRASLHPPAPAAPAYAAPFGSNPPPTGALGRCASKGHGGRTGCWQDRARARGAARVACAGAAPRRVRRGAC